MSDHPTSQTEFTEAFVKAYEANDSDGMARLIFDDGMPDEIMEVCMGGLTNYAGRHRIVSVDLTPYEPDPRNTQTFAGRRIAPNLTPEFWFNLATVGNEGFRGGESSYNLRYAVGVHDGKYFFCGQVWADE